MHGKQECGIRTGASLVVLLGLGVLLGGCGSTSLGGLDSLKTDIFGPSSPAPAAAASASADNGGQAVAGLTTEDVPCPDVQVRHGASTLIVGNGAAKQGEPSPLDVRYQGSLVQMARECHVHAGVMTMKVGVEGRVITGPAGGAGSLDVPLRVAVVKEGVNPVTITTQEARIPVTINNDVDRVSFTHVYPDISFPLPQPLADIDSYVVYVGFDPLGAEKKKPARRSRHHKR
jgi:hypothetical protein